MKSNPFNAFATAVASAVAISALAAPVVDNVTMEQNRSDRRVTISYTLANEPGVITVDIQTNAVAEGEAKWVSIGVENLQGFGGDVYRVIQTTADDETRTIHWNPDKAWPGTRADAANVRAVVTAWATNAPPDYCVVHLVSPYDVTYYPCKELLPGGIADKRYKGEYMAFRKIPAAGVTWWAGTVNYPFGKRHQVLLTEDYYMAVYELTHSQWTAIDTGTPSDIRRPLSGWGWGRNSYRGSDQGSKWPTFNADGSFDYETSHAVDPKSPLGLLRGRSGLQFDLPTEAQWEYAARAGSPGESYTDEILTSATTKEGLFPIARFYYNRSEADCEGRAVEGMAAVGSYLPNAWGLYDVLGNATEICLDRTKSFVELYPDDSRVYVDPVGPSDGTVCMSRGRSYEVPHGSGDWSVSIGARGASVGLASTSDPAVGARFCINLR